METKPSLIKRAKILLLGKARSPQDSTIFYKLSLIAFFAWIGLGADGLSSSCYGPQEAFLALNGHTYLSILVAIGTVITIFIISASYSQIVELFPTGGGGYFVATKLLSPTTGMISGCALLIDYVLTITVSIASGADAVFSLLPLHLYSYKLIFALGLVIVLMLLNMRGVKESVLPLVPIFLIFLITHIFIILYTLFRHMPNLPSVATSTVSDIRNTASQVGFMGVAFLVLRAYSMGAGTYTGLEAVSNGIPILREPKVETAKRTMRYMAISLSFVVIGLMVGYLLYGVTAQPGKTLNAILFGEAMTSWGGFGYVFIFITLISEAALLCIAAQTGFLDGPRVLANMAGDRWFPTKFASLSDRLVMQNGVLIMSSMALAIMILTRGSVRVLVVLYSINVFITFVLSQLGMVRHWWLSRKAVKGWHKKFLVNGVGLMLCGFILISMITVKFREGGWVTLLITGSLIILALLVKRHYHNIAQLLNRLNSLVAAVEQSPSDILPTAQGSSRTNAPDPNSKTAVLLVNGFNGIGLHTLFGVIRFFGGVFKNFVFIQVGVVDVASFKDSHEVEHLQSQVREELDRYVKFMKKQGYYAEGISAISVDVVGEITRLAPDILERFPNATFFGGQLVFPKESIILPLLHNYTVFALQKKLYLQGIPFVILPIRV